jgi:hypothetical protein
VAAFSNRRNAENALYPVITNPYGIAPRLTGFVNAIFVQATKTASACRKIDEVTEVLNVRHRVRAGFAIRISTCATGQIANAAEATARYGGAARSGRVDLVARGGIGIDILLVSVTERTREIGCGWRSARSACTCCCSFSPAVILSVTGGIAGIIFGVLITEAIAILASGRRSFRYRRLRSASCFPRRSAFFRLLPRAQSGGEIDRGVAV